MLSRREFLKSVGFGLAGLVLGCGITSGCGKQENNPAMPPVPQGSLQENLDALTAKIIAPGSKIIAYSPTNYNPNISRYPSEASIRADLETLACHGFNGILTYGCLGTLASIPRIATETGFSTIITGVWDPKNSQELANAINSLAYSHGYCIGNEQLGGMYALDELENAIQTVRNSTNRPTTTTQQDSWYSDPAVVDLGDFLLPNAHPWWANIRQPAPAADYVVQKYDELKALANEKIVLMKEAGLPTAGDPEASEENQKEFFAQLSQRKNLVEVYFAGFEAFDQPWKASLPVEPHWGLCKSDRSPKLVLQ